MYTEEFLAGLLEELSKVDHEPNCNYSSFVTGKKVGKILAQKILDQEVSSERNRSVGCPECLVGSFFTVTKPSGRLKKVCRSCGHGWF